MRLKGTAYVYLVIIVIVLFMILWSLFGMKYGYQSKLMPVSIGSLVILLSAIGLWQETKAARSSGTAATEGTGQPGVMGQETWRGYLLNLGWVVGFLLGIYLLGYLIAIPLFVLLYMKRLGARWLTAIISAVVTTGLIYALFEIALELKLYRGLLGGWLGF